MKNTVKQIIIALKVANQFRAMGANTLQVCKEFYKLSTDNKHLKEWSEFLLDKNND
jgi:hypothetical protein